MHHLQASDPTSMGGYPLLGRLGAGGMGKVYLSRTTSGRLLALKTIREDLSSEPGSKSGSPARYAPAPGSVRRGR